MAINNHYKGKGEKLVKSHKVEKDHCVERERRTNRDGGY